MSEQITVDGITYQVVSRKATTEFLPWSTIGRYLTISNARGQISLYDGKTIHCGTEEADGRVTGLYDTKFRLNGSSARSPHPLRARRSL